jgi:RecA-family ATPase
MPPPARPRLINKLLSEGAIVLLYGDWGSGKSLLAVDLAGHLTSGRASRGLPVLQGPCVYFAGEAGPSIGRRVVAWNLRHGIAGDVPLGIVPCSPNLLTGDDLDEALAEAADFAMRFTTPLRSVFVDAVHAAAPGCEETAKDFGRILAAARRIAGETGAAVVLVHHSGQGCWPRRARQQQPGGGLRRSS